MTDVNCNNCNLPIVEDSSDAIECEFCNKWYHASIKCSKLTKTVFTFLTKSKDSIWICFKCTAPCRNSFLKSNLKDSPPQWVKVEIERERALAQKLFDSNKELNVRLNEKEIEIMTLKDRLRELDDRLGRDSSLSSSDPGWTTPGPGKTFRPSRRDADQHVEVVSPNRFEVLADIACTAAAPSTHDPPLGGPATRDGPLNENAVRSKRSSAHPSLKNLRTKKRKIQVPKINVIGDSHARHCSDMIQQRVGNGFFVESMVAPGAPVSNLVDRAAVAGKDLQDGDLLVLVGGVNDMTESGLAELSTGIDRLSGCIGNKSLVWTETPLRYDNPQLNSLIVKQNRIISSKCKQHNWAFLNINSMLDRSDYTKHGLHWNRLGKELVSGIIAAYSLAFRERLVKKNLIMNLTTKVT
jgi:hypothetical protein